MIIGSIDIGGSSVKSGIVEINDYGHAKIIEHLPTCPIEHATFSQLKTTVLDTVAKFLNINSAITDISISTTGSVDLNGTVQSGRFEGYQGIHWATVISQAYPQIKQCLTSNDGKAFVWAEYTSLGSTPESFIHIIAGSGIGGGIIVNGKLLEGISGRAGHIGHTKVNMDSKRICSCGTTGCVECFSAGNAMLEIYQNKSGEALADIQDLVQRANQGDSNAINTFQEGGWWLGISTINLLTLFNPAVITLGGGLFMADKSIKGSPYLTHMAKAIEEHGYGPFTQNSQVRLGKHNNDGGILGAALIHAKHFKIFS